MWAMTMAISRKYLYEFVSGRDKGYILLLFGILNDRLPSSRLSFEAFHTSALQILRRFLPKNTEAEMGNI